MRPRNLSRCVVGVAVVAASLVAVPLAPRPASALTSNPAIDAGGVTGMLGLGATYGPCGGIVGYDDFAWWDREGNMERPLQVADKAPGGCSLTVLRWELYPGSAKPPAQDQYDPFTFPTGGAHTQRSSSEGAGWQNIGTIPLPHLGDGRGAFRVLGDIVSSTPVPDGRVKNDMFQISCGYPDSCEGLPTTSTGAEVGTFASTGSRGNQWTAGVGWPGRYLGFFEDTQTGAKIQAMFEAREGSVPALDLDAICFGFDTCVYTNGGPPAAKGGAFHPVSPVRILDTRTGLGIGNGAIRPGDGRLNEPDPLLRRDEIANHELKVTGQNGVPESGVAAVLLNVTASQVSDPGFFSLVPKPQRVNDIFNDNGSFGALPSTSNLNVLPGIDVPNMVMARVGAGGKIRIYSNPGSGHLIADLAGWIDNSGALHAGSGFVGVTPKRLVDTRLNLGGGGTFGNGEDRVLKVAGVNGVPADATSVVLNITGANAAGVGWAAAYPSGQALPNASNINLAPGRTRANLAVVKVGTGGSVRLRVAETTADLIVDVFGYYGPGGGMVVPVDPTRIADTRAAGGWLQPFETRQFGVAGVNGIPANAKAVVVNVTATPGANGYLTVWPAGTTQPTVSTVNFTGGQDVPNLAMVGLGQGGQLSVFNELGTTDVMLDVMAYVV